LRRQRSGKRVLPVFYSDNYLSLLPGESKSLTVEATVADLGGDLPMLAVDGWNVTTAAKTSKDVSVGPNPTAWVRNEATSSQPLPMVASVNCGGGQIGLFHFGQPDSLRFARDWVRGGKTTSTTNAIDIHVPNAAPLEVYQTERWSACAYTIPAPKTGTFTVRLHFAETRLGPGQRKFNVEINGRRVLEDFDIAAEAGKDKALFKDFPSVKPDAGGNITIKFARGSADEPKVCGIQVLR
jgi:hypothetical protein